MHRRKQAIRGEDKDGALAYYEKLVKDLSKFDLWLKEVFSVIPVRGVRKEDVYVNILTILIYIFFAFFLLLEYEVI